MKTVHECQLPEMPDGAGITSHANIGIPPLSAFHTIEVSIYFIFLPSILELQYTFLHFTLAAQCDAEHEEHVESTKAFS